MHASVVGSSHAATGAPCQDASLALTQQTGGGDILILVASDGAGTAARSDVGASLVCSSISLSIAEYVGRCGSIDTIDLDTVMGWIDRAVDLLQMRGFADGSPLRDYACTLLGGLVAEATSAFFQIGDGAIVIGRDNTYHPIFWPTQGEYANTTVFLTDDQRREHVQFLFEAMPLDDVAVFTDGLQSLALKFDSKEAHSPFFRPLFARLAHEQPGESVELKPQLIDWLRSPSVTARTDDDKTLALATRRLRPLGDVTSA